MPEVAREKSKEGLLAFSRYWFDLVSHAYATGDLDPVMDKTGKDCQTCKNFVAAIATGYQDSGWSSGGKMVVEKLGTEYKEMDLARFGEGYRVILLASQEEVYFYESDGTAGIREAEYGPQSLIMLLTYDAGQWRAQDVGITGDLDR